MLCSPRALSNEHWGSEGMEEEEEGGDVNEGYVPLSFSIYRRLLIWLSKSLSRRSSRGDVAHLPRRDVKYRNISAERGIFFDLTYEAISRTADAWTLRPSTPVFLSLCLWSSLSYSRLRSTLVTHDLSINSSNFILICIFLWPLNSYSFTLINIKFLRLSLHFPITIKPICLHDRILQFKGMKH